MAFIIAGLCTCIIYTIYINFVENATSIEIEELLAELHLMKNIEPHENILNLLGQCTTPGKVVTCIIY